MDLCMIVMSAGKIPQEMRFNLQSIESSGFNELVQINHQKLCNSGPGRSSGATRDQPGQEHRAGLDRQSLLTGNGVRY